MHGVEGRVPRMQLSHQISLPLSLTRGPVVDASQCLNGHILGLLVTDSRINITSSRAKHSCLVPSRPPFSQHLPLQFQFIETLS